MDETQATLGRLEARIEEQEARIDALYAMLERLGLLPRSTGAGRGDALFDDAWESPDPSAGPAAKRSPRRLRVGTATGV